MLYLYRSHRFLFLVTALILLASHVPARTQPNASDRDTMGSLVTTEWLSEHLDDPDLVILDCTVVMEPDSAGGFRSVSGRPHYKGGHIPSAVFADLKGELCDGESSMAFAMPTPEQFCAAMGALGVGDDSRVVLYDALNSVWAARVWWMLRWVGFDRAAVLDGGFNAWKAEGRQLATEQADPQNRQLTLNLKPELIADRDEVFAAISDDAVVVLDVMPEPHYRGDMVMYDRPGHIKSAISVPVTALLDSTGCFRSHDALAALFTDDNGTRCIAYCGAGIAASCSAFIMTRLGYKDVAVYMGSLQEWAADPANPMEVVKH